MTDKSKKILAYTILAGFIAAILGILIIIIVKYPALVLLVAKFLAGFTAPFSLAFLFIGLMWALNEVL